MEELRLFNQQTWQALFHTQNIQTSKEKKEHEKALPTLLFNSHNEISGKPKPPPGSVFLSGALGCNYLLRTINIYKQISAKQL